MSAAFDARGVVVQLVHVALCLLGTEGLLEEEAGAWG